MYDKPRNFHCRKPLAYIYQRRPILIHTPSSCCCHNADNILWPYRLRVGQHSQLSGIWLRYIKTKSNYKKKLQCWFKITCNKRKHWKYIINHTRSNKMATNFCICYSNNYHPLLLGNIMILVDKHLYYPRALPTLYVWLTLNTWRWRWYLIKHGIHLEYNAKRFIL